jgi:predicted permease
VNAYTDVLTPLKAASYPYQIRLREGVEPAVAAGSIDRLVRAGIRNLPPQYGVRLTSLQDSYVAELRPVLWSVLAGSALVLLIAAANVVVLMIARARDRERDAAVRLALGASHFRVATLLAFEGVIVTGASVLLGAVTAWLVLPSLVPLVEASLERRVPAGVARLTIDARVMLMAGGAGALVAMLLAIVPVVVAWRSRDALLVASSGRGLTESAKASHARAVLIAVEIASSLTLLVGASLLMESAVRMLRVEFGFSASNVVTASLVLRQRSLPTEADRAAFFERLETELRGYVGNNLVAFGNWWPLQGSRPQRVETRATPPRTDAANPFHVSSAYFDTLGVRLRAGRAFTHRDRLGSDPVVIVSASLAERLWHNSSAVGESIVLHPDGSGTPVTLTVVGVVTDVRQSHDDIDLADVYLPLAQRPDRFAFMYFRQPGTETWEADVRAAITRVHREVAMGTPRRLQDGLEQERVRPQFLAFLLAAFALFASVLALVGMHGVIASTVHQRQREIALRMALGADARRVMTMFLRYAAVVVTLGLGTGVVGALALGSVLQSQLFEVRPYNPPTLALAVVIFASFALPAILWPAWRATTLDPAAVLKHE